MRLNEVHLNFYYKIGIWSWLYWIGPVHSAQILGIFTVHSMGHFNYHMAMMESLLAAGHHVTIVAPYMPHFHPNLTVINSSNGNDRKVVRSYPVNHGRISWILGSLSLLGECEEDCYNVMSEERIKVLKNFDVMFVEAFHMYQCYLPLAKILKIPIIGTTSCRYHISADVGVGNSRMLSTFPVEVIISNFKMTFLQRIFNTLQELELKLACIIKRWRLKAFYDKRFPGLKADDFVISLLFANNHVSLFSKPITNTINIGGIYIKSAVLNPLPKQLNEFMEKASNGVILLSLGSIFSSKKLDSEILNALISTFSKIPQRVIWKFDGEIENISDNVLLSKWIPQKEVLAHKNIVAFISHCGISSTYEAIYFGKPLIMVPLFGDQPSNAGILKDLGVGVYLHIMDLNEANLHEAISEVVNNTKYRQNMENLSQRFKDEPISPSKLVVYWTEYVIRNKGASGLRSVHSDMSFYQYFLLDIIACVMLILIVAGLFVYFAMKYLVFLISKIKTSGMKKTN